MDKIKNRQVQPFFMLSNTLIDDGHLARMGAASAMVYLCLCRHANSEHQCFPSYSKLQEETGMARATTSKAISNLLDLGYVRKLELKRGMSNIYEIMDFPELTSSNTELVQEMNQFKNDTTTSSNTELVQEMNQFKNDTTTSSKIEPLLVQKLNSKNTKGKRLNEKDPFSERGKNPNERVKSRHGEIRSLIAERVEDVESFLDWKANKLKTYSMYQDCNVSAAVVLQFYANKLPYWDAISGDSQAVTNLIELIESDILQFTPPSKPVEARKNDLDGIVPEYQNTPEILDLSDEEFQGRFGISLNKFKNHLFENQLL